MTYHIPHFCLITSVSSVQFDGKIMELPILDSLVISTSPDDAITSKKTFLDSLHFNVRFGYKTTYSNKTVKLILN